MSWKVGRMLEGSHPVETIFSVKQGVKSPQVWLWGLEEGAFELERKVAAVSQPGRMER